MGDKPEAKKTSDNGKKAENGEAVTSKEPKGKTQQKPEVAEKQASSKSASSKSDPGKAGKKRDPLGKAGGGGGSDDEDEDESEDDNSEDEGGSDPEDEDEEVEGRLDALEDRIYEDELVGRRVRAEFSDEGWSTGFITYFNTKLDEYRAEFPDGSEDYFKKDEIDGVETILLPPD